MTTPQSTDQILNSLMLFGETLRRLGIDFGTSNMLDLVRATEDTPIGRKQDFYQAARSLLVHRKQDLPVFDEAFNVFWRRPATGISTRDLRSIGEERRYRSPQVNPPSADNAEDPNSGGADQPDQPGVNLAQTYSAKEVLRAKDFAQFTPSEVAQAKLMLSQLSWELGHRRTRRTTAGEGAIIDLRKTIRNNLKYGGELVELSYKGYKAKPHPLVMICDISGSMERYTRIFLHFIHAISGEETPLEAFLFATRLTRITRFLQYRSTDQAIDQVSRAVPDWAGGTRIGEALKTFNYQWARRVLRSSSIVMIISDGWDRGEPELLSKEMARLHRSCHRLIWLNPLLGSETYQPLTRGIQAALPHVDDFLPAHNLNSLVSLTEHLNRLKAHRGMAPGTNPYLRPLGRGPEDPALEESHPPRERRGINPALGTTFRQPLPGQEPQ